MAVQSIAQDLTCSEKALAWKKRDPGADKQGYPFTIARMVVKESLQAQAIASRVGTADGADDMQVARQMLAVEGYRRIFSRSRKAFGPVLQK